MVHVRSWHARMARRARAVEQKIVSPTWLPISLQSLIPETHTADVLLEYFASPVEPVLSFASIPADTLEPAYVSMDLWSTDLHLSGPSLSEWRKEEEEEGAKTQLEYDDFSKSVPIAVQLSSPELSVRTRVAAVSIESASPVKGRTLQDTKTQLDYDDFSKSVVASAPSSDAESSRDGDTSQSLMPHIPAPIPEAEEGVEEHDCDDSSNQVQTRMPRLRVQSNAQVASSSETNDQAASSSPSKAHGPSEYDCIASTSGHQNLVPQGAVVSNLATPVQQVSSSEEAVSDDSDADSDASFHAWDAMATQRQRSNFYLKQAALNRMCEDLAREGEEDMEIGRFWEMCRLDKLRMHRIAGWCFGRWRCLTFYSSGAERLLEERMKRHLRNLRATFWP